MNLEETNKILSTVAEIYPAFRKDRNPVVTADIWQKVFARVPYLTVSRALMAYIATDTKGFPPSPGAINERIAQAAELNERTEAEAWMLVLRAVGRGIYNSREEYEKLPPDVREIVGGARQIYEWAMMDSGEVNTVIASHFKRAWRARRELRRTAGMCPALPGEDLEKIEG